MQAHEVSQGDRISVVDIDFGGPATYRIVVQGTLDASWSDRLGGMTISTTERGQKASHTTLIGPVRDQAQLNGVLEALYGLHLSILSVEKVRESPK